MADKRVEQIHKLIKEIVSEQNAKKKFVAGKTRVKYAEPLFDGSEINEVIDSLVGGWLAEGERTKKFEEGFANFIGTKHCTVVNSGSSALLLSFAALADKSWPEHLEKGDEVITSALTFPTSLNAIILNGLSPVLVDADRKYYNFDASLVEEMITEKTRAILAMHHLGNQNEMDKLQKLAKEHNLFIVEDCCDSHGSTFNGKVVGSFGEAGSFSFYGAHAMTMGEGGAITSNLLDMKELIISLKTCGLHPKAYVDYEKRTLYTTIGYKMRVIEMQGAMALKQLDRLPGFVKSRRDNFKKIVKGLKPFENWLELPVATPKSNPSWFSVPFTLREDAGFPRKEIVDFLEKQNIETRPLLGGNVLKQPAYENLECRTTAMTNTDYFHDNSFYVGCHPGLTNEMIDYMVSQFEAFLKKRK